MTKQDKLINELDVLDQFDLENYTMLGHEYDVRAISLKAALLGEVWFPKSQLRTDPDGNIYVSNWLYEQI